LGPEVFGFLVRVASLEAPIMVDVVDAQTDETEYVRDADEQRSLWKRPPFWVAIGLLTAFVVALFAFVARVESDEPTEAVVNTAEVTRADLVDESTFEGTLGRPEATSISAGAEGIVTSITETGIFVSFGDELFRIDDSPVTLLEGELPAYRDLSLGDTQVTVPAGRSGVLTWLASEGDVIGSGAVVARIDEKPVVALEGSIPMYRMLRSGVEGEDVLQLEEALVDLGYDSHGDVTVDEEYTAATSDMVERWQEELGVGETGQVALGDVIFVPLPAQILSQLSAVGAGVSTSTPIIQASGGDPLSGSDVVQLENGLQALGHDPGTVDGVYDIETASAVAAWTKVVGMKVVGWLPVGSVVFLPTPVTVTDHLIAVGTSVTPSSPILSAAPEQTIVRMELPAQDQELLSVGTSVIVVLPDRSEPPGTVSYIASVAELAPQGGGATFDVEIKLDDPSVVGDLDEAPVDIRVVSDSVENVLAVPVTALLALAEGGYAVEVIEANGTRLVAVEPGFFGDGLVEISGSLEPGTVVVVP
jgi:peptidoglycan hydrolase-like protein with peptidoglycan-binding domain